MVTDTAVWIAGHLNDVAEQLMQHGRAVGPFLPWHHSSDPFQWLVAETLLRRTTRTAAHKAFLALTESYPNWKALASAPQAEIAPKIAWVGLGNQRSKQLEALARVIVEEFGGVAPVTREGLLGLPGVGPYTADVLLLYAFGERAFPLDPNVQRVFRRLMGLPVSRGTRRTSRYSDPYRDPWMTRITCLLLQDHAAERLVHVHRGVLHIAWTTCRSRPDCAHCPAREVCQYAARQEVRLS